MAKRIEVIIPRKGLSQGTATLKFETKGFIGTTCQQSTKFMEALGVVVADEPTNELYALEEGVEHLREGHGE